MLQEFALKRQDHPICSAGPANFNSYPIDTTSSGILGTQLAAVLIIKDQSVAIDDAYTVSGGSSLHGNVSSTTLTATVMR